MHENAESLLSAHVIREYLDHYKMDYTLSVYLPEIALQHSKDFKDNSSKTELLKKVGIESESGKNETVIVQMMQQLKQKNQQIEALKEEIENLKKEKDSEKARNKFRTNAEMAIEQEHIEEDINLQQNNRASKVGDPLASSDNIAAVSGGISSSGANAIDHSIDTLQLEQYDYVEEVKLN